MFAIGDNPRRVMTQMGHTTANLTLSIYAQEMAREDGEPERLCALVNGEELALEPALHPAPANDWHPIGTRGPLTTQAGRS